MGYFSIPFNDYSTNEHRVVSKAVITRYRLEKKDPSAAVSEPVTPIVFYLSPEIPAKWRPYLKQAVEQWRGPLEEAGFKNAIFAKDAPTKEEDPDWDPGDLRYSVIRWAPGPRENALGPNVVDPRSGEVISSHTLVWHDVLRLVELWYFTQVAPLDPRAKKLPLPDDLEGELLRYVVVARDRARARACGTTSRAIRLTRCSSCAAGNSPRSSATRPRSWTTRASTTWPSRATTPTCCRSSASTTISPSTGATESIPGAKSCADQWPELDRMAARQIDDPALRFGGENDAADGRSDREHAGSRQRSDRGHRHGVAQYRPRRADADSRHHRAWADPTTQLSEVYQALLVKRQKELSSVAKMVGGVEEMRYHAGRGTVPFKPVAAERQRKAVKFLLERGFTRPDALLDPQVLWRMAPYGGADALQDTNQKLLAAAGRPRRVPSHGRGGDLPGRGRHVPGRRICCCDLNDGLFSELKQAASGDRSVPARSAAQVRQSAAVELLVDAMVPASSGWRCAPDRTIWHASWTRRRRRCAIRKRGDT